MKQNFTVRQGALDGVEAFLSVAQHRSFRRAAAELGVTPSAISQAVRALEARVGAALFMRTTRSVGLTEAGERFLSRAKPAFEELVAASEVARDLGQRPAGLLRLSVPRAVVPILLEPLIASFCQAYPEVEVEIAASEELVDLVAEGFDAGIRLGQFIAPDMWKPLPSDGRPRQLGNNPGPPTVDLSPSRQDRPHRDPPPPFLPRFDASVNTGTLRMFQPHRQLGGPCRAKTAAGSASSHLTRRWSKEDSNPRSHLRHHRLEIALVI